MPLGHCQRAGDVPAVLLGIDYLRSEPAGDRVLALIGAPQPVEKLKVNAHARLLCPAHDEPSRNGVQPLAATLPDLALRLVAILGM